VIVGGEPGNERLRAASIALFAFAMGAAFVYRQGMAEPDSVVMAAGMAMGMGTEAQFGDALLYGRQVSPGMYFVARALYPLFFDTTAHLMGFLNWLSIASFAGLAWLLYRFFRSSMTPTAATAALLVLVTTPLVWESSTYFHPLVPAAFLLAASALAWRRFDAAQTRIAWLVPCALLAALALVIRVEIVWGVPAALVAILAKPGRVRRLAAFAAVAAVSVAAYAVVSRLIAGEASSAGHSLRSYASMIHGMYAWSASLGAMKRSVPWMVMGMGVATLAAVGLALANFLTARRNGTGDETRATTTRIVVALVWVLPAIAFWLPQPTPILRHYFLSAIGLAWLAGCLVPREWSPRRIYLVALAIAVLNLALPEAAYRAYNRANADAPKTANGAFFYYHAQTEARIARQRTMARQVMETMQAAGSPGAFAQVDWEGYAYMAYEIYTRAPDARRITYTHLAPRTAYYVFRSDGAELRLIQTVGLARGAGKDAVTTTATEAAASGLTLFLSRDALLAGIDPASLAPGVVVY
jgi:hypothetical protein